MGEQTVLIRWEGEWTLEFDQSLKYTRVYSSMQVGTSTANWREGVGDHGPWSQPALCSCHRAVCGREGLLLTGGEIYGDPGVWSQPDICSCQISVCR